MKSSNTIFNKEVVGFTKKDESYITYGKNSVLIKAGSGVIVGSHANFTLASVEASKQGFSSFDAHDVAHYGLDILHENVELKVAKLVKSGDLTTPAENSSFYVESPALGSFFDTNSESNRLTSYRLAKSGLFLPNGVGDDIFCIKGTASTVEILESLAQVGFKPADMALFGWRLKFQSERVFKLLAI